ncbi:hypothetical protein SUGI_0813170 [Cryptomeria japonica]|nr:hypothetical protein SUGI_0813170 [Cryptomeria japonica]
MKHVQQLTKVKFVGLLLAGAESQEQNPFSRQENAGFSRSELNAACYNADLNPDFKDREGSDISIFMNFAALQHLLNDGNEAIAISFITALRAETSRNGLQQDFYRGKNCSQEEPIVFKHVEAAFYSNLGVAPGLTRMHFHDRFIRGCDTSVLIDSTLDNMAEKDSPANSTRLCGFEVIDTAKAELEVVCPEIVTCAVILAFATRDSAFLVIVSQHPLINFVEKYGYEKDTSSSYI